MRENPVENYSFLSVAATAIAIKIIPTTPPIEKPIKNVIISVPPCSHSMYGKVPKISLGTSFFHT